MTKQDILTLLGPSIAALLLAVFALATAVITGLLGRVKKYFDDKGDVAASNIVANASAQAQNAMANAAGNLALKVQNGTLDITNASQVEAAAKEEAGKIALKIPDAINLLAPLATTVAEGVSGKLGQLVSPGTITPVVETPKKDF